MRHHAEISHYWGWWFTRIVACCLFLGCTLPGQTVQPLIAEYTGKGAGSFAVTNSSFRDVAVILEAQSFRIDPDGKGVYRSLDPAIHLQLSATSLRLGPRESRSVFYKVNADAFPAWFTVYATFAPLHPGAGVNLHVMLPHTVYLYSKRPLGREDVRLEAPVYDPAAHTVTCELVNIGSSAGRVASVDLSVGRSHSEAAGFPLLPGSPRKLVLPWTERSAPAWIEVNFDHFTTKAPVVPTPVHPVQ